MNVLRIKKLVTLHIVCYTAVTVSERNNRMSWNTHNIVAPPRWSVYDMLDRPVIRKTGEYPDDTVAILSQPTTLYTLGYTNLLNTGTVLSRDITLLDVMNGQALSQIIPYIVQNWENWPEELVYHPRDEILSIGEHKTLQTRDKLCSDDINIQGPSYNENRTGSTDGYTFTLNGTAF